MKTIQNIKTKKIPNIKSKYIHKLAQDIDYSTQVTELGLIGSSSVASIFSGNNNNQFLDFLQIDLGLNTKEFTEKELKRLRQGKEMEDILLNDFYTENKENIKEIYKNKYRNGNNKYSYSYTIPNYVTTVRATPDAWYVDSNNENKLVELKHTDNYELVKFAKEYNLNGNFLGNKWFFKYFLQVQIQLYSTNLEEGVLYIDYQTTEGVHCIVKRNDELLAKVLELVYD